MRIQFLFKWFDFWVGLFWDQPRKKLYILPLPMVGIVITFGKEAVALSRAIDYILDNFEVLPSQNPRKFLESIYYLFRLMNYSHSHSIKYLFHYFGKDDSGKMVKVIFQQYESF